jgi:hypothetical protein
VVGSNIIYDDVIGSDWQDVSTGSIRNFSSTNPVKVGTKSIKVDYTGTGTLAFNKGTAVTTTANTQLRFWVYNSSRNGIRIYTESGSGVKGADLYLKPAGDKWVEIVASMSQLGNPSSIKKVTVQNNSSKSGTMYFDQIQLTNVSGAASSSSRMAVQKTHRMPDSFNWQVFPNPAKDLATIRIHAAIAFPAAIDLIDNTGRKVYHQSCQVQKGWNQWQVNLPGLSPGVYYLRITSGQAISARSVLIQ